MTSHQNTTKFYKKSFAYFFRSRFLEKFNYFYTRVRSFVYIASIRLYLLVFAAAADAVRAVPPPASCRLIRLSIARPIHCYTTLQYAVNIWSLYIYAEACWKLATVVKDDLNVQNSRKSDFRYSGNGIQSARIVSTFSPFSFHLLGSPDFLFSSSPENRLRSKILKVVFPYTWTGSHWPKPMDSSPQPGFNEMLRA